MNKRWYHEVDAEWLKARRTVITATEIAKLVTEYKRYQKAKDPGVMPGFAALWCEKMTDTEPDVTAVGPAARGHICEPWAVEAWNKQMGGAQMHHWDDSLIRRYGVGFSPDALDIPQAIKEPVFEVDDGDGLGMTALNGQRIDAPWRLLEIKSYDPAHHMKCCIKDKMDQDELMQIAVPFIVCPTMEKATLVFFCPDAPISMKAFTYTRDELAAHIDMAEKIIELWNETMIECTRIANGSQELEALCTDDEIYEDYLLNINSGDPAFIVSTSSNVFMLKG